ncbi:MAG: helix-turn-helix domain-containing protein [Burkholderiaceae bacterium]|nr:helix-turn-helix domain-containing protein [Burkholderiaceae bacterium]
MTPRVRKLKDSDALIGQHLKTLRAARGMTLDRLAVATGLTKGYLSKIQNSRKLPPIATLSRIAQALGTGIGSFFGDIQEPGGGASIVRKHERLPVVRGGTAFGYDYVSLAHDRLVKRMEPFVFTFPSKIDRHVFFDHGGEEFVFILSGKVIFQVGDERWNLAKGDSIYFDAAIPHRGWSVGPDATALVVIHAAAFRPARPARNRRKAEA